MEKMSITLNPDLKKQLLIQSAELYLEIYQNDTEIQELTESALNDFSD